MEWHAKKWCITMAELTSDDRTDADQSARLGAIMTRASYDASVKRKRITVIRRGGGVACPALISYDSLPDSIKERVLAKYPDMPSRMGKPASATDDFFRRAYQRDLKAMAYYVHRLTHLNNSLPQERIEELVEEYTVNASVIQAVRKLKTDNKQFRRVRNARGASWAEMKDAIEFYRDEYGHTLATSPARFAQWVRAYEKDGYDVLITQKFGNANKIKVDFPTKALIAQIASHKTRPNYKVVWQWYCDFLAGKSELCNRETGEVYNPSDFPDLSEKTVGNVLADPVVQAMLSKVHDARHDYNTTLRPHHKRMKPQHSLSMISMDDKDFTVKIRWYKTSTKLVRGRQVEVGQWIETSLKAYIAYDVASEAIVGYCFSGEKNRDIFEGCVVSMYRNLLSWGLGQPYEAQVENHLVSLYKDTMMKSGHLFTEVTFAGAENSQEKYAERYNHTLKYLFEKYAIDEPVGRPHARLMANRTKNRKVSNSANNEYKQHEYSFEEAVRVYEQIMDDYNNALHPNQKLYPGKTRLEVLLTCVHPEIQPINPHQLARWAGKKVDTSLNRGMVRALGEDYAVSVAMQHRLTGRSGSVIAYAWQQSEEAPVEEVYLYEEDVFLGTCPRIIPYQVSKLERTEADLRLLGKQAKRIREWDEEVEELMPDELLRVDKEEVHKATLTPVRSFVAPLEEDTEIDIEPWLPTQDYASKAWADL